MNFLLFLLFYFICTLILFILCFVLYKLYFKQLILTKLNENALLSAFDSLDQKSILDINLDEPEETKKEEEKKNEKVYTYF